MKRLSLIASLVLAAGITGCDQPSVSESDRSLAKVDMDVRYAFAPPPASEAAHRDRARGSHQDVVAVSDILDGSTTWAEADVRLRDFLGDREGLDPVRSARRVQAASIPMIRLLSTGTLDDDRASALLFYVREAVAARSPEAETLETALSLLEPHRTAQEMARLRAATAANARAYADASVASGRTSSEQLQRALAASEAMPNDAFEARILRTAERLESAD